MGADNPRSIELDGRTSLASLKAEVRRFRDARNWLQFHDPKNLAMALGIEVGELQELFLWKSEAEVESFLATERGGDKLREEIADCFSFLLHLADRCNVDLSSALYDKLLQNEKKYPVEKSFNSNKKYTEI